MSSEKSSDGGHCGNDKEDDGACMRKEPKGSENDASTIKKKSPTSATLIKDALKPNLSAVEATTQLKVLCRKFAALMEKVKEESRIREDTEKEVRRLKAIIAGNDAPVIASARAETQAYIHDLKEAYERLKQELRTEKDKNAKLVSKALELEKDKSVLLAMNQAGVENRAAVPVSSHLGRLDTWDREQVNKINATLKVTIDELQEELSRKEDEISSYKDRWSRERGRVKELEKELQERELAADEEGSVATQLEQRLREQQDQCAAFENEVQLSEERLQEALSVRKTLEEQIDTLNDVNLALEQRANVLMRRLELNNSILAECDELKSQLHDSEVDKETLVRSIKELKDQHFRRETDWKCQMEKLRSEKLQLASQIADLQADTASLRAQNALFSEWMLVRKENTAVQLKEQGSMERIRRQGDHREADDSPRSQAPAAVWPLSLPQKTTRHSYQNYDRDEDDDDDLLNHRYAHTSSRCPLSPSKTKSMTTASPIKQGLSRSPPRPPVPAPIYSNHRRRESIGQACSPPRSHAPRTRERRETHTSHPSKEPQRSNPCTPGSSKLTDHERLRALMSRNRELQQRLQQETIATRNLEDEITQMTTINTDHKRPSL